MSACDVLCSLSIVNSRILFPFYYSFFKNFFFLHIVFGFFTSYPRVHSFLCWFVFAFEHSMVYFSFCKSILLIRIRSTFISPLASAFSNSFFQTVLFIQRSSILIQYHFVHIILIHFFCFLFMILHFFLSLVFRLCGILLLLLLLKLLLLQLFCSFCFLSTLLWRFCRCEI